ncbi:MAG: serine hydrolase domain-containing protein [Planctomycetota bacterium]
MFKAIASLGLVVSAMVFVSCTAPTPVRLNPDGIGFVDGKDNPKLFSIEEAMARHGVPGLSVAVIRGGELAWAKGYGVLQAGGDRPVDTETVFSVASVSKLVNAALILGMVEAGELELDRDVEAYLMSWGFPENRYTRAGDVTLRRLLSHTAGTTVQAFADYQPGEELPTTVEILEGRGPAKNKRVRVNRPIGRRMKYSGGGVTVTQLVVEDVTGRRYAEAAAARLFEPLGMTRSSFENPLPASHGNIAKAHDVQGRPRALPRGYEAMPEAASSGLWTTPTDLARLMIVLMDAYEGQAGGLISPVLVRDMMTEVSPGPFGLGPALNGEDETRVFEHTGSNESYKALIYANLATKDGIVVLTNGANGRHVRDEVLRAFKVAGGIDY